MQLHLESTNEIALINGEPTRIWKGTTGTGIAVTAFIRFVSVANDADQFAFAVELEEMPEPAEAVLIKAQLEKPL
jgi:hypothetical protein